MNKEKRKAEAVITLKYFGWWFAWGVFSGIMLFIVAKGGGFGLGTQIFVILGFGVIAGSAGLFYSFSKRSG